jgi:hypothetical protein
MFADWLHSVYAQIEANPTTNAGLICPECQQEAIDFQYIGDPHTRMASLQIWCTACYQGVHLARVHAPQQAQLLDFDTPPALLLKRIPRYQVLSAN